MHSPARRRAHIAFVFFAAIVFAVFARVSVAQRAALVTVDAVSVLPFAQTLPVIGRLVARRMGAATARIDGTVAEVHARVGESVSRGDLLATLDTELLELQLQLARAQHAELDAALATANAELKLAAQEVKRLSGLTDSAAVSRATIDDARQRRRIANAKVREAAAAVAAGAAELKLAELNLEYAEIKAPFAGAITERFAEVGGYLRRGDAVAQLVSARELELEAAIPAARLGGISAGARVEVVLDNGSRHRATARAVVPEEEPRTRTRPVRFHVDFGDDAGLLAAEQSVTVFAPAGAPRDILSVHKDAIVRRGGSDIAFVVVDDAAAIRNIVIGAASGERVEVLSGLAAGDLAVVRGNERLQPGQAVKINAGGE